MNVWEMLSISSYALTISLIESSLVCLLFVLIGAILPFRYFREKFVSHTTVIVMLSALWAVAAQQNYVIVYNWTFVERLPWIIAYLSSLLIVYGLTQFSDGYASLVTRMVQRISVLATLYILLGVVGLLVVVVRNI